MNDETQNIIAQQLQVIPKELREAIVAVDYPEKLRQITEKNKLLIDQAGQLEQETSLVLLGLEPLDDYVNNLKSHIGFDDVKAHAVAGDVNELIFKGVREALKTISIAMKSAPTAETVQTPAGEMAQTSEQAAILSAIEKPETISSGPVNKFENIPSSDNAFSGPTTMAPMKESASLETMQTIPEGERVEIRPMMSPEIAPHMTPSTVVLPQKPNMPATFQKPPAPFHDQVPPVANIVTAKLTETVIAPKQNIVIEEKTKLPNIPRTGGDPYREPIA